MKAWSQALKGEKLPPTVSYLETFAKNKSYKQQFEKSPRGILKAFQSGAARRVAEAYKHLEERKKYLSPEQAANQTGIELTKVSELHCQAFLLQTAIEVLEESAKKVSKNLGSVLIDILELYAVDLALRYLGNLLEVKII